MRPRTAVLDFVQWRIVGYMNNDNNSYNKQDDNNNLFGNPEEDRMDWNNIDD